MSRITMFASVNLALTVDWLTSNNFSEQALDIATVTYKTYQVSKQSEFRRLIENIVMAYF